MAIRSASAEWKGNLIQGQGTMKLGSGAFEGPYSFASRFESGKGTNPEELIGAAHAGCFSMALSAGLGKAGFTPTSIRTSAKVHLEKVGEGFGITRGGPEGRCFGCPPAEHAASASSVSPANPRRTTTTRNSVRARHAAGPGPAFPMPAGESR